MLDIKSIRENKDYFISGLSKRKIQNPDSIVNTLIDLDNNRKILKTNLDNILSQSNSKSKEIGINVNTGNSAKIDKLKKENASLKQKGKKLKIKLTSIETKIDELLYSLPNIPHENVPYGEKKEDNEIIFETKKIPVLKEGKAHWNLIKEYDIIDFELGNKLTGAGFPVYINKGAKLQRALINYFLDEAIKKGYVEIQPPILVNENSGFGTGQLPDKEGQMYQIESENLYLIPTAEVPLTNMYRNQTLENKFLPIKNVAYTPCFRKEAGSWGSHVRGLNRLHQFDKVEIIQIQTPEKSYETLEKMCNHVESLLKKLELPYRILKLCSGDLGFTASLTYDFEVYAAGQKKWLECSSVSNFETYQSNRLKLKIKSGKNKVLAHTLNGSALALPRIMASIIENNQTKNGIKIPKVLTKFTGFDLI